MSKKILVIKSSPRGYNSQSNLLVNTLVGKFKDATVTTRDVSAGIPFVTETMIGAFYSNPETHNDSQKQAVTVSNELVKEVLDNDIIIIGSPLYNFSIPAALKAYIDLIVRVGITFKYGETGQFVPLVHGKKAYVVLATGGASIGSPYDGASSYLKTILGFIGITEVEVLGVSGTSIPEIAETAIKTAKENIEALAI